MRLNFGLNFKDLKERNGLLKLDRIFFDYLEKIGEKEIAALLNSYRKDPGKVPPNLYSDFLTYCAPILEDFLSEVFFLSEEIGKIRKREGDFDVIYEFKRKFLQRIALKKYSPEYRGGKDFREIETKAEEILGGDLSPKNIAEKALDFLNKNSEKEIGILALYCARLAYSKNNMEIAFKFPQERDPDFEVTEKKILEAEENIRIGFGYRPNPYTEAKGLNESRYCLYCHKRDKDSCSKGFFSEDKKDLKGCPLKQKISESLYLKSKGLNIAALAVIVIDNPLVALTGKRICVDCSKACIYQKQDPVDVPSAESAILNAVTDLSFGTEIYLLLTLWNPLNIYSPLPKEKTGYKILVAGLGPAGIALSHYLLNEGHSVVATDGFKISSAKINADLPIEKILRPGTRIPSGFGGVLEYGITDRWNKNLLDPLRALLERRKDFKLYGGVALGLNLKEKDAFALGFDFIAVCTGAGAPKFLKIPGGASKGVLSASDFLITLQNGGVFLENSNSNLTLRLPVAVIGGGLTAVDAATEAVNYYPVQVKKFKEKYAKSGLKDSDLTAEEKEIKDEFLRHADLLSKAPRGLIPSIVKKLGGVTIYYRGETKNSPAYKTNPAEIAEAAAYSIDFEEGAIPAAFCKDPYGYLESISFSGKEIKARSALIAIGLEDKETLPSDKISFFGDADPEYRGSVVKALASAKYGYRKISEKLPPKPKSNRTFDSFVKKLDEALISRIEKINYLSEGVTELLVKSPLIVKNFKPGMFFRLQNYSEDPTLTIEPIALTGAYTIPEKDILSLIILGAGKSSFLCRNFRPGEIISLTGPSGEPTEIKGGASVVLIGGGLGNATLISVGKALKEKGSKVTYFAGYKKRSDIFYPDKIEEAADKVIWCAEEGGDSYFKGNVIGALRKYKDSLGKIDRVICVGSAGMMEAVRDSFIFDPGTEIIFSLNSHTQCCMKGICGRCVQTTTDGDYVFACAKQDAWAAEVDFVNLKDRLAQNSLFEKIDLNIWRKNSK